MADEPDLAEGSEGEWVTYLQGWLQQLGFYQGAVDGEYGPVTTQAVAAAQSQYQLGGNGSVGTDTWKLLELARGENQEVEVAWGDGQQDTVDVPDQEQGDEEATS